MTDLNPSALSVNYADGPALRLLHGSKDVAEAIVGTAFTVSPEVQLGLCVCSVRSAPAGSTAAFSGRSFNPDYPGRYKLRAYVGASPVFTDTSGTPTSYDTSNATVIDFDVIALPAGVWAFDLVHDRNRIARGPATNAAKGWYNPNGLAVEPRTTQEKHLLLRRLVNGSFGSFDDATWAALTDQSPLPSGINLTGW